jgi:ribose transport system permease protein
MTTAAARRPAVDLRRVGVRHGWTIGVYVLLAIALAAEIAIAPRFTSFDLESLLYAALPLAFAAMAQAVVVISGGIDLSVGPVMALVNVSSARLMLGEDFGTAIAIALGLIVAGAVIGALTGAAIVVTRVPDIVVTLATSFIWAGLALYVLPEPGGGAPAEFLELVTGNYFWEWIPNGLVVLVVAIVIVWFPIRRSRLGLAIYAIGSDRNAAFLSGINVARTRIAAYAIGGLFAALGGLALTAQVGAGSAQAEAQAGYTLRSVAAIVLGGVSLLGGSGGLIGPVAAAFVLAVIDAILVFENVDPNWSAVIRGTLIVLVVMIGGLLLLRRRT